MRSLGVKGLDCSAGCGVFLGYGFGVGLFLKPKAAEAMQLSMQKARGALSHTLLALISGCRIGT